MLGTVFSVVCLPTVKYSYIITKNYLSQLPVVYWCPSAQLHVKKTLAAFCSLWLLWGITEEPFLLRFKHSLTVHYKGKSRTLVVFCEWISVNLLDERHCAIVALIRVAYVFTLASASNRARADVILDKSSLRCICWTLPEIARQDYILLCGSRDR